MKYKLNFTIIFFITLLSGQLRAENQFADSLSKLLLSESNAQKQADLMLAIGESYLRSDYKRTISYATKCLQLASKTGYRVGEMKSYL